MFVTVCTVGDMETEGEGNGKKVSKRRAAERMLEEMRTRWPPAMLRARPPHDRRRHQPNKKKPRNLIKVSFSLPPAPLSLSSFTFRCDFVTHAGLDPLEKVTQYCQLFYSKACVIT